jgi:hypothetical protein
LLEDAIQEPRLLRDAQRLRETLRSSGIDRGCNAECSHDLVLNAVQQLRFFGVSACGSSAANEHTPRTTLFA